MSQKVLRRELHPVHEAAAEAEIANHGRQRAQPRGSMHGQQDLATAFVLRADRVVLIERFQLALQTNELAARVALLFEPVGEDEARRVIVWRLANGVQKVGGRGQKGLPFGLGSGGRCRHWNLDLTMPEFIFRGEVFDRPAPVQ